MAKVRAVLPKNAVLVGACPDGDVRWCDLKQGRDFEHLLNLTDIFRTSQGTVFSLQHLSHVLLRRTHPWQEPHDARWDAQVSVELYNKVAGVTQEEYDVFERKLIHAPPPKPNIAKQYGFNIDGVCLALYSDLNCTCGRKTR